MAAPSCEHEECGPGHVVQGLLPPKGSREGPGGESTQTLPPIRGIHGAAEPSLLGAGRPEVEAPEPQIHSPQAPQRHLSRKPTRDGCGRGRGCVWRVPGPGSKGTSAQPPHQPLKAPAERRPLSHRPPSGPRLPPRPSCAYAAPAVRHCQLHTLA